MRLAARVRQHLEHVGLLSIVGCRQRRSRPPTCARAPRSPATWALSAWGRTVVRTQQLGGYFDDRPSRRLRSLPPRAGPQARSTIRTWLIPPGPARTSPVLTNLRPNEPPQAGAALAAERVAAIIAAAESTAENLRSDTEERARERIAEAQRAADNRVRPPRRRQPRSPTWPRPRPPACARPGERTPRRPRTAATNEALGIIARAEESAAGDRCRGGGVRRSDALRGRGASARPARGRPRHRRRRSLRGTGTRLEPPRDEQLAALERRAALG